MKNDATFVFLVDGWPLGLGGLAHMFKTSENHPACNAAFAPINASSASNDASPASNDASMASDDASPASNDASMASDDASPASNDASMASDDGPFASNVIVKVASYADITPCENDTIDWNSLNATTFATTLVKVYFPNTLIRTETCFYWFNGVYWQALSEKSFRLQQSVPSLYAYYIAAYKFKKLQDKKWDAKDAILKKLNGLQGAHTTSIMTQLKTIVFHSESNFKWNANPDLFVFEDIIFDLSTLTKVSPSPQQMINLSCGYSSQVFCSAEEQEAAVSEITAFIIDICGDPCLADYLMHILTSFMRAGNVEEKIYFFLGNGRNGKGTLMELVKNALGSYYGELQIEYYVNQSKGVNEANANLMSVRNARVINTSEIDVKGDGSPQKFLSAKVKNLSGGDTIMARAPHSSVQHEFKAGKCIIQTNVFPEFSGSKSVSSTSLKERVVCIQFPHCYVDDMDLINSNPAVYKARRSDIKEKFSTHTYKVAFLHLLAKHYATHRAIAVPQSVKDFTNEQFGEVDKSKVVKDWIRAHFDVETKVPGTPLTVTNMSDFYQYATEDGLTVTKAAIKMQITLLCGKRDKNDKEGTHGVFTNGNNSFVQGFLYRK
jgi:phage/plasmid-associated DNA primase